MPAHVVSFFRSKRSLDWSNEELAQLYRVENALTQLGMVVEVERGLTDEGDPWFVYCKADGDIIVHIARYDGAYLLIAPSLQIASSARSFTDLVQSFVQQFPLSVPVRTGGNVLFHPAALMTMLVAAVYFSNEQLQAAQFDLPDEEGGDGEDASWLSQWVTGAPGTSHQDANNSRIEQLTNHLSAYLNVLGAAMAVVLGLNFDAVSAQLTPISFHTEGPQSAKLVSDSGFVLPDLEKVVSSHSVRGEAAIDTAEVAPPVLVQTAELEIETAPTQTRHDLPNEVMRLFDAGGKSIEYFGGSLAVAEAGPSIVVADAVSPARTAAKTAHTDLAKVSSKKGGEEAGHSEAGNAAPAATATEQRSDPAPSTTTEKYPPTVVISVEEFNALLSTKMAQDAALEHSTTKTTTTTVTAATVPPPAAYPEQVLEVLIFDQIAADKVKQFLKSHDKAAVVIHEQDIKVVDTPTADASTVEVVLQTWDFASGGSISLVGHMPQPVFAEAAA
ncbi:MAG TPA: hypothetical protein VNZ94_04190 [Xanthobacteraceae bacterium]|nr:hypothetical protein [Xanthobacteraceae bacterium]